MSAQKSLTAALQKQVLRLEDDLRVRVERDEPTLQRWQAEHHQAVAHRRTAASWQAWRDDRVTQAAVGWVLTTVFVRFCEDNRLVEPVWIAGPPERRQEALDAELAFYRERSGQGADVTARDWLLQAVAHLAELRATAPLVDEHAALHLAQPSGDAAGALLEFWRERGDDGSLVHDFTDELLDTRFLGDLYQDLSEHAKSTFALLQTPEFVEEFILDQTLEPALAERPLEGFRLIDPTCGSGHFLLGAFDRLLDRWQKHAPGTERQALVQQALDAIHGVDLNPFAVAIARFRLTVAALKASGLRSLEDAPGFGFHLAVGDSLLHGPQQTLQGDVDISRFTYSTEDLQLLQTILVEGRYDAVVGNPPYITVKDSELNQAYRGLYRTCKGTYALTVPFMERFFGLAKLGREGQPAGWTGQITSNSFMKREFGSKLIEDFLVRKDLRLVADTSGAYIPGHGTPTVILVGRNQRPVGTTIRAVLGVRGEPGRPEVPAEGLVWRSIVDHLQEPGWEDSWITVSDLNRGFLARHPWSLSGGGAAALLESLNEAGVELLSSVAPDVGFMAVTREDDAYAIGWAMMRRRGIKRHLQRPILAGMDLRDWHADRRSGALCTYDRNGEPEIDEASRRHLWTLKPLLLIRRALSGTQVEQGLKWWEYSQLNKRRFLARRLISFAFVSTHNHFVLSEGDELFIRSAPVIKLHDEATDDDHLGLLGALNSSIACFWWKQNSHNKGRPGAEQAGADEPWEHRFEFTGTTLQDYPLPASLPLQRSRILDGLAHQSARWAPEAVLARGIPTAAELSEARLKYEAIRANMIAQQEELDWEVYCSYGLVSKELTYRGDDLPALAPGERAFAIKLAREIASGYTESSWFAHHNHKHTPITDVAAHWPDDYQELVRRRLELMDNVSSVKLLERPEYKRRWTSEPWEKRQTAALRDWLLDRLEDRRFWFDRQGRPAPRSVAQLADEVARNEDLVSVLALWEGRPDVPVVQSLVKLLADEAVPYLAAYRYKDSGLRKREAWEHTWTLQRREDAGERLAEPIPVPPKYTSADFRRSSFWEARGKLDVPKERFILYPDAGRETDATPLLGWAGWDHAQQSLALSVVIGAREADGWDDARLVPLVAGLAELQPWVEQWHAEVDPAFGVSLAAFCREQLTSRASQVGRTLDQLAAWRPEPATRGRRPRGAAS